MSLIIQNLTGGYANKPVVFDINITSQPGELTALIGLNGAGKSTIIKHIIGQLQAYSGQVRVNDTLLVEDEVMYRKSVTYIPETPILYDELTLKEHVELMGLAYGLTASQALEQAMPYLKAFRLDKKLDWFPALFSKGMKQKVMITCAFMIQASVYIIDEPFLGLDPIAIKQLLQMIAEKKQSGSTILMSTHVLATAQQQCDRFVLLHNGRVQLNGTLDELRQQTGKADASLDDLYIAMVEGDASC